MVGVTLQRVSAGVECKGEGEAGGDGIGLVEGVGCAVELLVAGALETDSGVGAVQNRRDIIVVDGDEVVGRSSTGR